MSKKQEKERVKISKKLYDKIQNDLVNELVLGKYKGVPVTQELIDKMQMEVDDYLVDLVLEEACPPELQIEIYTEIEDPGLIIVGINADLDSTTANAAVIFDDTLIKGSLDEKTPYDWHDLVGNKIYPSDDDDEGTLN
jgi:hypothetical protein